MRLQKYMADCGVGSRRACEKLIQDGKISVNGQVVTEMGFKVDEETCVVAYEGRIIKPVKKSLYIALHKPVGYITSSKDQFMRPTVIDLAADVKERVFSVGRLDYDSSGLIFLTNDGDFAYRLTHPKHTIYKKYAVTVKGVPSEKAVNALKNGVVIDGIKTMPSLVDFADMKSQFNDGKETALYISIMEGRNRQVRKMFQEVGYPVVTLHRIAIGNVHIGSLKCGEYRFLSKEEVRGLVCSEN